MDEARGESPVGALITIIPLRSRGRKWGDLENGQEVAKSPGAIE